MPFLRCLFIDSLMIYITAFLKTVYKVNIYIYIYIYIYTYIINIFYIYNKDCWKMLFLVILPI